MKRLVFFLATLFIILVFSILYFTDFSKPQSKYSIGQDSEIRINEVTPEPNRILPPARHR